MVSVNDHTTQNVVQPAQAVEDSFGEQFFPQGLSRYAPEGRQGFLESGAWKVRENPWMAVGIALAAGVVAALVAGPIVRAGFRALAVGLGADSAENEDCTSDDCDSNPNAPAAGVVEKCACAAGE